MFSIVVPTRNRPRLLLRALAGIRAQSLADWRAIVVDDGDGSGIAAAAALGDARILCRSSGGRGQVPARNLALAAIDRPLVAWLDDDDQWCDPDHLARLAAAIDGGDRLAHAAGRIVVERATAEGDLVAVSDLAFAPATTAASLARDNTVLASGVGYPAAFHARYGGFDERLPIYWDWDWYLRLVEAGVAVVASGGTGVRISWRDDNTSGPAQEALRRDDLARFAAKHRLEGLALRNHRSIAEERAEEGSEAAPATPPQTKFG